MANVILALSAGIESTYLLHKVLSGNNRVHIVFGNLSGPADHFLGEMLRAREIIDWFKKACNDKDGPYSKSVIDSVYWNLAKPYMNPHVLSIGHKDLQKCNVATSQTQQYALIQMLMEFRKGYFPRAYPTTVVGWIREDATEFSLNEYDFTEDELKEMLELPVRLGRLSNSDLRAKPFRAPLWNMTKQEIWRKLPAELKQLVLPNGSGSHDDLFKFTHRIGESKRLEYEAHGIPYQHRYDLTIPDNDFGFLVRLLSGGSVAPVELGLPEEAISFVSARTKPFLESKYPIIKDTEIEEVKYYFKDHLKRLHEKAVEFTWPVPTPTVEILADVGDGPERVELLGER